MRLSQKGNLSSAGIHSSSPPLLAVPCLLPCTPPNHLGGGAVCSKTETQRDSSEPSLPQFPL